MKTTNNTDILHFLLLGLTYDSRLQLLVFGMFLSLYLVTMLGNLLIVLVSISDSHLHTPMYFFLSNLSFVDICFSSTTIPKLLVDIQTQKKDISYLQCLTQAYFLNTFAGLDNFLLSVMAYDRFVAICRPLNYMATMSPPLCCLLVVISWIVMFWISLAHILLVGQLTFITGTEIPHFLCELAQILKVASSDTHVNDIFTYIVAALVVAFPINGIVFSYCKIVSTLMRMSSMSGKYKAFSTCGSHLCVVCLFYGTSFWVYFSSSVTQNTLGNTVASMMYTVVTPMLNPFIYSLRNKDVKKALKRFLN